MEQQADRFLSYLQDGKGYSDNTIAAYRNDLRQFMTFLSQTTGGAVNSWVEVDQQLIQAYGKFLEAQAYAASTVARKVASVKSFFSFLLRTDQLTDNPTSTLCAPKVKKHLPRVLGVEDVKKLLDEPAKAMTPKALRDRALLELLYATGMRVSEAITLQLDDLDMARNRISCVGRDRRARELSLTSRALEALSVYLEKGRDNLIRGRGETTLFVNQRGYPLTRQGLWLIIKSYAEAAGLGSSVTPHTLRHSCAAHRLAGGTDLQKVRELLGHANLSTTQVYVDIAKSSGEESDTTLS